MLVSAGPASEFLKVIAHRREAARMRGGGGAQEFDGLAGVPERNHVSQRLEAGYQLYLVAEVLGNVVAVKLFEFRKPAPRK